MTTFNAVDAHVGRRIALRRKAIEPDAAKFAASFGIDTKTLDDWESGKARVGAAKLFALSEALSIKLVYFFEGL
jgi:transcriptional regulator with XRE-family HTH domain